MKQAPKRILILISILSILIVVFLLLYSFPKKINFTYPAIEFSIDDTSNIKPTSIKVEGTLSQPLIRNPYFKGQIIFEHYNITKTYSMTDFDFLESSANGVGGLVAYHGVENGRPAGGMFGFLWISKDFEDLTFQLLDTDQYPNLWISAPASNYEEAVAIYKKLTDKGSLYQRSTTTKK